MPQRPIEIILAKQLASYLAVPILIVDREMNLLFFNESAEPILGRRFDETGEIRRGEWNDLLRPTSADGNPIPRDEQVLVRAVERNEPTHRRSWLTGLDGVARVVEGLGFPLDTPEGGVLGGMVTFWAVGEPPVTAPGAPPRPKRLFNSGYPVEIILLRRLFDRLTMPAFVVGPDGRLIFYNPAAEPLIGRPFEMLGPVELRDWYDAFHPTDEDGSPIKREDHPMYVALRRLQPSYRRFQCQGLDGVKRLVEGTAFPLIGQCQRHLGAVGFFWEGSR